MNNPIWDTMNDKCKNPNKITKFFISLWNMPWQLSYITCLNSTMTDGMINVSED